MRVIIFIAYRYGQIHLRFFQFHLIRSPVQECFFDFLNDHLCDPVTRLNGVLFLGKIDKNDLDLATIICVDGPGCIQTGNAVFYSQATSWTYLCFIAMGQFDK